MNERLRLTIHIVIGLVIEIRLSEEEEKNSFDEEKGKRLIIFTRRGNNYEINCTLPICSKKHKKNVFLTIRTKILRKEMKNLNLIQKSVKNSFPQ